MKTLFASPTGTGDGSTQDKAGNLQALGGKFGPGDTFVLLPGIHVFDNPWWVLNRKGASGCRVTTLNGQGGVTIRFGACDGFNFSFSDNVTIDGGITFEQLHRDPSAPGFKPVPGNNAIHFAECNNPTITDVTVRFATNGIVCESSAGVKGGTLTRVLFDHIYCENPTSTQGQGLFLNGQSGWLLLNCDFETVGWDPRVTGTANMFRHAIYSKAEGGSFGPYTARYTTFRNCASSGPTADTGCELDHCTIDSDSNVPTGMAGAGAYQVWGGGAYSKIHGCKVRGNGPGILLNALRGDVFDNTIFWDGSHPPLGVDLQSGKNQQRDASCVVNVVDNDVIIRSGVTPPASLLWVGAPCPALNQARNQVWTV